MKMISEAVRDLVQYGLDTGLLDEEDRYYARNQILRLLGLTEYEEPEEPEKKRSLEDILETLLDYAAENGLLEHDSVTYRDLFDTKLMNCLMPRPSEVSKRFRELYEADPEAATRYFYKLSQDSDYIRRYRVCKDMKWVADTEYGALDVTVNLSKPERIPGPLPPPSWQSRADIPNAFYAWRTWAMPGGQTIRPGTTTGSFP